MAVLEQHVLDLQRSRRTRPPPNVLSNGRLPQPIFFPLLMVNVSFPRMTSWGPSNVAVQLKVLKSLRHTSILINEGDRMQGGVNYENHNCLCALAKKKRGGK